VSVDDLILGLAPQALCLRLLRRLGDFLCKASPSLHLVWSQFPIAIDTLSNRKVRISAIVWVR
jgi:hypothetical protein